MGKTAVITGITGQDGFYLTNHLLSLDYQVVGIVRRTSSPSDGRLRTLRGSPNLHLVNGDVTDLSSLERIVSEWCPDEFYHLAAQSHVAFSWEYPLATAEITGIGTLNCLEALRSYSPYSRFYFAGSSEQFGNSIKQRHNQTIDNPRRYVSLNEDSPMEPESPYAAAKVFGYNISRVYRRSFDMFTACGILFNHESPVRGEEFVTRKITSSLARIKWDLQDYVELGNMDACRDWGFAGDYVRAMHAMLQHDTPDDFVIATGRTFSVKEFFQKCCAWFELEPEKVYKINPMFMRPKDVEVLLGDSTKAQTTLGWKPECSFDSLVEKMCQYDYHLQSPSSIFRAKADEFLF